VTEADEIMAKRGPDREVNADVAIETMSSTLAQLEKETAEPYAMVKHLTRTID
jgi:hypothetical protein